MAELDSVINAVKNALENSGLTAAVCRYPLDAKMRYEVPVTTIGLQSGGGVSCGFAEYMGMKYDSEKDAYLEIFGKRMDLILRINIYSPKNREYGSESCFEIFENIVMAEQFLPSGIKVKEITCGETEFDEKMNMFKLEVSLSCTAFLYAEREDSSTEFLDFIVKGVLV